MGIKFSVITINYNNNNGLIRTIKSVINQKYRNFEFIIIDGGSNDGSYNTITSYSSKSTTGFPKRIMVFIML